MVLYNLSISEHMFIQYLRGGDYVDGYSTGYVQADSALVCILWLDKQIERMDL